MDSQPTSTYICTFLLFFWCFVDRKEKKRDAKRTENNARGRRTKMCILVFSIAAVAFFFVFMDDMPSEERDGSCNELPFYPASPASAPPTNSHCAYSCSPMLSDKNKRSVGYLTRTRRKVNVNFLTNNMQTNGVCQKLLIFLFLFCLFVNNKPLKI